jgi:hypothetical protein
VPASGVSKRELGVGCEGSKARAIRELFHLALAGSARSSAHDGEEPGQVRLERERLRVGGRAEAGLERSVRRGERGVAAPRLDR